MYANCKALGFTLFELITVIAILAIISLLGFPYFQQWMQNQEVKSVTMSIQQHVSYAKSQALVLHSPVVICSSKSLSQCENNQWNHGLIIFTDYNKNKVVDENEKILITSENHLKYGNLKWKGGSSSTYVMTFQGDTGLPRGAPGSLHYCSLDANQNDRHITISKMGQIRAEPIPC